MDTIEYYKLHSLITDPQDFSHLYSDLPRELQSLAKLIGKISIHYQHIQESGGRELILRINEIYIRKITDRLKKMTELGVTNFNQSYDLNKKSVCSCRDLAVLLCSMLRHVRIAARVRYGFAQYLDNDPHFFFDHTLIEYWNEDLKTWCLTERYLSDETKAQFQIDFDSYNVPREKFITAAQAWIAYRAGSVNPNSFGTGYARRRSGAWYIRNKIIHDLAALNKMEMQPTDLWGYMIIRPLNKVTEEQDILLDKVAHYMLEPDKNLALLQDIYHQNDSLRVPNQVYRVRINGNQILETV